MSRSDAEMARAVREAVKRLLREECNGSDIAVYCVSQERWLALAEEVRKTMVPEA